MLTAGALAISTTAGDAAPADPGALRLIVDRDGPVAVTGADLTGAGWDLTAIDPDSLTLEAAGAQVPLLLQGAEDGALDPDDRILFYGQAMTGLYTRENVYWLSATGSRQDMEQREAPLDEQYPLARSHRATLHLEQDLTYFGSMRTDVAEDRWLWGEALHAPSSRDLALLLDNVSAKQRGARMRVRVYGYTDDPGIDPDHRVTLELNGRELHEGRFDGIGMHVMEIDVPDGLLIAGDNTLTVENSGRTGAIVNAVALDWVELVYDAGYASDGSILEFAPPSAGRQTYTISGFESSAITVLDVTDPASPILLAGTLIEPAGRNRHRVRFTDATDSADVGVSYAAFTAEANGLGRIERNQPSDLRSRDNGADYIAITHPDFADALEPLLARRREQGFRVERVLIQDVYDEFSHGVFDSRAIRAFLQHAYERWRPPSPSYVLLVGESNLDYRGAYGQGSRNFVPSVQVSVDVNGALGAVTSDLWYANLDADERDVVPEVFLGRFSVSTAAQAATIVSKTLAYEAAPKGIGWQRGAVMVVDDDGGGTFEPFSDDLIDLMPDDSGVRRFYAASYSRDRDISADISSAVVDGALVVNYVGHGNVDLWGPWPGGGRIYQNGDISRLTNGDRLPLFTSATCMNGWIDHPLKPTSMAELWLTHPRGGGVAAWSPSGFTSTAEERVLFQSLFKGLYDGRGLTIGALTAEALERAHADSPSAADTIRQFVLLGDPALVISGVEIHKTPASTPTPDSAPDPSQTPSATPAPPRSALYIPIANKRLRP